MKLTRDCRCGAGLRGTASPATFADRILADFDRLHTGDGHGPATSAQAAAARRRGERQLLAGKAGSDA